MTKVKYTPSKKLTGTHQVLIFNLLYPDIATYTGNTHKIQKIKPMLETHPGYLLVDPSMIPKLQGIENLDFSVTMKFPTAEELQKIKAPCNCGG